MPKHLYLLIGFTLLTGFAFGVYIFFVTRSPEPNVSKPESQNGYEIIAYTYGGCERRGCSSFKLQDNGTYVYIMRTSAQGDQRFEDAISSRQQEELETVLNETDFDELIGSQYSGTCPATYDGLAYRFEIRVKNNRYSFDTCREAIEEEALFVELTKYFNVMDATYRNP